MVNVNNQEQNTQLMCSETEFVRETNEDDGNLLMVIDENTDKVSRYCVAYKGRWIDL